VHPPVEELLRKPVKPEANTPEYEQGEDNAQGIRIREEETHEA